ncbi:hypothetical protein BSZ19_18455 [Bradyrhizobium japonicum]|uniref:HTH cro/C1-type domain-containing protein n=1 Tax=Bradyrhizobium japonicum TaxID=375 RepID=A0A1Y2JNX1_BRAJP|nr:helix-turn-helix transcriptional regulator [Bradyrhizobium japonicum]OSJ32535.1 hypothetical protein BSZ19_18455 [Bradyrhizobium japonicum]
MTMRSGPHKSRASSDGEALVQGRTHQDGRRDGVRPRGLTQLAAAAGVSKQMLSFIATGAKLVSDDVYRKVAEALLTEAGRMTTAVGKIETMAGRMFAELEE